MVKSTELVEPTKGGALTEYIDFGEDAGRGLEGASRAELLTPFITQLHYQCPQVEDGGEKYVDGARPGMLYNTVTRQLYDGKQGVEIVPVYREHLYTEWVENRGGFKGVRSVTDPEVMRLKEEQGGFKTLKSEYGTDITEQFNLFVLYGPNGEPITADNAQEAVIAFGSSRISTYKTFFTMVNGIAYPSPKGFVSPPLWAHRWRLRTQPKKNDDGAWFTYDISLVDPTPNVKQPVGSLVRMSDPLYHRAKAFNQMLTEGTKTADYEAAQDTASTDADIPF